MALVRDQRPRYHPKLLVFVAWLCLSGWGPGIVTARKHELVLEAEDRPSILITIFDFLRGGSLSVNLHNITITDKASNETKVPSASVPGTRPDYGKYNGRVGFVLDRTSSTGGGPYFSSAATISGAGNCPFNEQDEMTIFTDNNEPGLIQRIIFSFNFNSKEGKSGCNRINRSLLGDVLIIWDSITAENCFSRRTRIKELTNPTTTRSPILAQLTQPSPYSMKFNISMKSERSVGLYSLYFVHCNSTSSSSGQPAAAAEELVSLNMTIVAKNKVQPRDLFYSSSKDSFLYFFMGALFFGAGIYWAFYFRGTCSSDSEDGGAGGQPILRVHYAMLLLVVLKSLSLLFLAGHIHYLERFGEHKAGWAVPYYVCKILKSVLTFAIVLAIETGLAFTTATIVSMSSSTNSGKPHLTPKILIILAVVLLQVLSSVAEIITEESEAGQSIHYTALIISLVLNSVSVAIVLLYPVARKCYKTPGIIGAGDASASNGNGSVFDNDSIFRARVCTKKLKIFRRFYMVVFCYFYITRVWFGALLPWMLPTHLEWLAQAGAEITTLVVFAIIGYMFGPGRNNSYLTLGHAADDMNEVAFS